MEGPEKCSICLEDLETNIHVLECNHKFHLACIQNVRNPECPLCRAPLSEACGLPVDEICKRRRTDNDEANQELFEGMMGRIIPAMRFVPATTDFFTRLVAIATENIPLNDLIHMPIDGLLHEYHEYLHPFCPCEQINGFLRILASSIRAAGDRFLPEVAEARRPDAIWEIIDVLCLPEPVIREMVMHHFPAATPEFMDHIIPDASRICIGVHLLAISLLRIRRQRRH